MLAPLFAALLLQTAFQQPGAVKNPAESSPPGGDTVGYWQQRVRYTIDATLIPDSVKIVGHERGPKLRVFKFKPKRGYKRTTGHRSELTRIEVTSISVGKGSSSSSKKEAEDGS